MTGLMQYRESVTKRFRRIDQLLTVDITAASEIHETALIIRRSQDKFE